MSGPNWEKLVDQGRAKAFGMPWSEEELKAIYEFKIPVDYVRNGCLTLEEYKKETEEVDEFSKETGKKPLRYMNKADLIETAQSFGLNVTLDAKRLEIIHLIEVAQKKSEPKLPSNDAVV